MLKKMGIKILKILILVIIGMGILKLVTLLPKDVGVIIVYLAMWFAIICILDNILQLIFKNKWR